MTTGIVSKIIRHGNGAWRLNEDKTWDARAFGTTMYNHTPHWNWVRVSADKVPTAVIKEGEK